MDCVLFIAAVAMVHVYILKLMMTQIAEILITAIDNFSALGSAIMLIALTVVFIPMQSQIFLFGVIFQCEAMAMVVLSLRMQYLRAHVCQHVKLVSPHELSTTDRI